MSYIPDCRTDENYNVEALNDKDKQFVRGYDWSAEQEMPNFFNNLEVYFGEDSYIMHVLKEKSTSTDEEGNPLTYWDEIKECLADWMEMQRDELITSMIDSYEE